MPSWNASKKRGTKQHRGRSQNSAADLCLQVVDGGLVGIVAVAPFLFGGRHLLGRLVLVVLSCVVGVAWMIRQSLLNEARWIRTAANYLGLAAIALVCTQLVSLPPEWIEWLAPRNQSLLPMWSLGNESGPNFGAWSSISLTPHDTKLALATLVAYYLLFVTAVQRLRTLEDVQKLVKLIACAALAMGGFGLLQYLTSNGKFFWVYEYPFSDTDFPVKGSFTCRNHFANFLALGIGPLLAWMLLSKATRASRNSWSNASQTVRLLSTRNLLCVGMVMVAVAVLMTLSRGGALAAATSFVISVLYFLNRGRLSGASLYGFAVLGLVVVGLLSLGNYDKIAGRLDDFTEGSVEELDSRDARRRIWNANIAAIKQGGLLGGGAGSHAELYPAYLTESFRKEYTHAENSYLQIVTENGWLGLGLLVLMVLCVVFWCCKAILVAGDDKQRVLLTGAVVAGLVASLVHAVVDFIWFIPACVSIAILLAACALRLSQIRTHSDERSSGSCSVIRSRPSWIALSGVACVASVWAISCLVGPATASLTWDTYLLTSIQSNDLGHQQLKHLKTEIEQTDSQHTLNEVMIMQLRNVVARDPEFARAHVRLASRYLQLFESNQRHSENAMPIEQIRDAAISSQFASSTELQSWLKRALGENHQNLYRAYYHARAALKNSPLQAEAYQYLAKLCFLEGHSHDAIDAYVQQSLLLRPHSGRVLLEAGWQYLQLGEYQRAIEYWQAVYRQPEVRRLRILERLGGQITAEQFATLFQPDWHTLPEMWDRYRQLGTPEDWQFIISYGIGAAQREEQDHSKFGAARMWLTLSKMQLELENLPASIESLNRAFQLDPDDYAVRRAMGRVYLQAGQLDQAEFHLRWCLARKTDDPRLRSELIKASKPVPPVDTATTTKSLPLFK